MDNNKQAQRCIKVAMSCLNTIRAYPDKDPHCQVDEAIMTRLSSEFDRAAKALTEAMARIGGTFEEEADAA